MKTTDKLVDELVADLEPVTPPSVGTAGAVWLLVSALFVVLAMHMAGPIRPGAFEQLLEFPHFALEMLLGAAAALTLALAAFRAAVPGLLGRGLGLVAGGLALLWVLNYVAGLAYPALEPSMLGKRDHCVFEVLLYGLPPLLALLYWQRRLFALQPGRAAALAGVAGGILPALYMQIACMHSPSHILLFHIAPAVALAGLAPAMLWAWNRLAPR